MRCRLILLLLLPAAASADSFVAYGVSVDTSSITGTSGSLDFNFNPGPFTTQPASLQLSSFATDGSLQSCASNVQGFCTTGDVSGTLPGPVTFDNGSPLNDYFTGFTYGTMLSFQVSLFGPAIQSPDGVSKSGSSFAFSMFSDAAGTLPVLTTDTVNGFAVTIDINLDGSTTLHNFSPQTTVIVIPEPGTTSLALAGWIAVAIRRSFRSRGSRLLCRSRGGFAPTSGRRSGPCSGATDGPYRSTADH